MYIEYIGVDIDDFIRKNQEWSGRYSGYLDSNGTIYYGNIQYCFDNFPFYHEFTHYFRGFRANESFCGILNVYIFQHLWIQAYQKGYTEENSIGGWLRWLVFKNNYLNRDLKTR